MIIIRPYDESSDKDQLIQILSMNLPTYFDPNEINNFVLFVSTLSRNKQNYNNIDNNNDNNHIYNYFFTVLDLPKQQLVEKESYSTDDDMNKYNIVGGIGCYYSEKDNTGTIEWIFIHPDLQQKYGYGTIAINYCHQFLQENYNTTKKSTITKFIVSTSQLAYKFFEKFNYTTIRTENNYWGKNLHLYLMELQL